MEGIRLSKALASAGVASRRAAEQLIFDGRVTVNGEKILLPQHHVVVGKDRIEVDGKRIRSAERKRYFILHKPKGYLCSNKRRENERLVIDLFSNCSERLFTVGRLDKDSSGLLIVTNDGQFGQKVIHPSSNIKKEYVLKTQEEVDDIHLKKLSAGTYVEGSFVKPVSVKKMRRGTVKITVMEGKKREVRLMAAAAGLKVRELCRVAIGGLRLGKLPLGCYRELSESEKAAIFDSTQDLPNA